MTIAVNCVCLNCSKNFQVTEYRFSKGRGKFCSKECFNQSITTPVFYKICEICEITFVSKRQAAKFCSSKCYGFSIRCKKLKLTCFVCKKDFEREDYYVKRLKDKNIAFCSHGCATIYSNEHRFEKRIFKCMRCFKEEIVNASDSREKYCSHKCFVEDEIERYKNNPYSKIKYIRGIFFSKKNNREFFYRSSFEKAYMEYLEKDSNIKCWNYEGIEIPYYYYNNKRIYKPDFVINNKIVEIKPFDFLKKRQNIAKFAAARKYAEENNMEFEVLTEIELQKLGILK